MAQELVGPNFYSYDLQVETKINIDELIYILTPEDLPLLSGIGSDGLGVIGKAPVDNTVFYWMEEDVPLPRSTVATAISSTGTTALVLPAEGSVKFAVGDAIRVNDEIMLVTANNTGTETLTVTRGALGTTAAASHLVGAEIIGLGTVLAEGDIGTANFQGRDKYSNYTQIFSKKLTVSRTEQSIPKYGVPNELNKQMRNAMLHCNVGIEQAAL
jgi:1-aminocyclopropane-1-carboxylate deaminase/D-cysteine desulfhydrase-like pyridoxal-dependent ACC family enzyme